MGATANQANIELLVSAIEFRARVGLVDDYFELEWLGFKLDNLCGIFRSADLTPLIEFCSNHPEYHIVSTIAPGRYVNKYVPDGCSYALANGDKNPTIMLNHLLDPQWPLILEDAISAAFTEPHDVKNGSK
ncbi:MAG: hypothetical protein NTY08_10285 [Proteobacteria bacterium]|nr:hypothetical protein [Pseudomonadota bacterium]